MVHLGDRATDLAICARVIRGAACLARFQAVLGIWAAVLELLADWLAGWRGAWLLRLDAHL